MFLLQATKKTETCGQRHAAAGYELPKQLYLAKESLSWCAHTSSCSCTAWAWGHGISRSQQIKRERPLFVSVPPTGAHCPPLLLELTLHFPYTHQHHTLHSRLGPTPPFPSYPPCLTVPQSTHFMRPSPIPDTSPVPAASPIPDTSPVPASSPIPAVPPVPATW